MTVVRILLACALAVGLTVAAGAEQKGKPKDKDKSGSIDKGKLVGKWEVAEDGLLGDKGGTYEFTKDGKINMKNKKGKGGTGTYKIDGDTITISYSLAGSPTATTPPMKVTKLTDKELVLDGPAGGSETKLTKK
jgi:uncharacterized protein (TIGR03066 family)